MGLWHDSDDYGLLVFDILLNYPHNNEHVAVSNINLITHKIRARYAAKINMELRQCVNVVLFGLFFDTNGYNPVQKPGLSVVRFLRGLSYWSFYKFKIINI